MISKVLVANRGEIARRVFRTCREMGISTVAVYSEPDMRAPFVMEADESVPLGGATSSESYLRGDLVIAAARQVGATAIHPGYGFLSENAEFARACGNSGVTFIGPTAVAIEAMGSKLTARDMMERAGVPVLPGADLTGVTTDNLLAIAEDVGWPVLVKASYGGGGRGMRVVRLPEHLEEAIASARREAGAAFGDETVYLEHYVDEPRHVEMQIFGDTFGTITHLFERECSIQRRHQKIIEEAPSPVVDHDLRARMGTAAVDAGRALSYVGAGTVEFLLAPTGDFFFLEINTRLQVEHPVTELVTGLDLVRLQLEVADGKPLPEEALRASISGHAIEARLYAEDAQRDFLPAAGTLHRFSIPNASGIRVDSGVISGDLISTNYDPLLAKVIAHGSTREEARARLARALRRTRIQGVATNRSLLVGILENEEFAEGTIDTHFLGRNSVNALIGQEAAGVEAAAALAAALAGQADRLASRRVLPTVTSGFRTVHSQLQERRYRVNDREIKVGYRLSRTPQYEVNGESVSVGVVCATPSHADIVVNGVRRRFDVETDGATAYVSWANGALDLTLVSRFPDVSDHIVAGSLVAPMPGTVVRVAVDEGERVASGQTVVVLEAMKMEYAVTAPAESLVERIPVALGDTVDAGTLLIVLTEEDLEEPA